MLTGFAVFYYAGLERLQFGCETPNEFACVLAVVLPFVVFGSMLAWGRLGSASAPTARFLPTAGRWRPVALYVFLLGVLAAGSAMLVATYSRGGYVAYFCALLVAVLLSKSRWHWVAAMIIFAACLALMPRGMTRASSLAPSADLSIGNRLVLWRWSAILAADFPRQGVGPSGYEEVYRAWYQPSHRTTSNFNAVNNALTIAAYHGLPALTLAAMVAAAAAAMAWQLARRQSPVALASLAGQLAFHVAGVFSCLVFTPLVLAAYVLAVAAALVATWREKAQRARMTGRAFLVGAGGGVAAAASILVMAQLGQAGEFRFRPVRIPELSGNAMWGEGLRKDVALLWINRDFNSSDAARNQVRPLFEKLRASMLVLGFNGTEREESAGIRQAVAWLRARGAEKIVVIGSGSGSGSLWKVLSDGAPFDHGPVERLIIAGDGFTGGNRDGLLQDLVGKSEVIADRRLMKVVLDREGFIPRFEQLGGQVIDCASQGEASDGRRWALLKSRILAACRITDFGP